MSELWNASRVVKKSIYMEICYWVNNEIKITINDEIHIY